MAVNTTWSSPATAGGSGGIDLAAGDTLSETVWDRMASDLYRLGGADGNSKTGALQIGSATTFSNGFMNLGLSINQGTDDAEILSLKSSDVAHGVTTVTDTDTYGLFKKSSATDGGLYAAGLNDTSVIGMNLQGVAVTDDTTKSLAAVAPLFLQAGKKSGTNVAALGANANLAAFNVNGVGVRFILDGDGDSHQDVGTAWTNFDQYDDAALLNVLAAEVARPDDPIKEEFRGWLDYHRTALEEARLVAFNADGHHFVNMSRLTMLLVGAVRQQGLRLRELERRLLPAG